MPQIKPYQIQTQVANVPDVPVASAAQFGSSGEGMKSLADAGFQLAGIIQKRQEQSEVSDIHVALSKTQADWTNQFHTQLQDGSLNTEQFTKDFNEYIDKQGENVSTRAGKMYFQQASAQLKGHFLEQAAMGQAELAGAKAKDNYMQSLGNGSSTLLNDPSSFEMTNQMQNQGVDNLVSTGGLPAKAAAELKLHSTTELAKSAVRGWIKLNPDDAKEQLDSGKWDKYVDGDLKHQLLGEADQATRARTVEDERLKRQQKEIIDAQQTETQNGFLKKMSEDGLSTKEILESNLDPFGSGSKEQFIKLLQEHDRVKSEKIKTDPGVYIDLWDKVHLPDGDPNKINNENDLNKYMGRGLTVQDINTLRGEIQGKKTIAGQDEAELKKGLTDIAKGKLTKSNPLTGMKDPLGDTQYQKFLNGFLTDYQKLKQEGKSPQQLLNPESPDYLGKNIDRYVRTQQQQVQDLVKSNRKIPSTTPTATPTPAPEPRKSGEDAASYLKRIGK